MILWEFRLTYERENIWSTLVFLVLLFTLNDKGVLVILAMFFTNSHNASYKMIFINTYSVCISLTFDKMLALCLCCLRKPSRKWLWKNILEVVRTKSVAKIPALTYQVDQATQSLCPPLFHATLAISNPITFFARPLLLMHILICRFKKQKLGEVKSSRTKIRYQMVDIARKLFHFH